MTIKGAQFPTSKVSKKFNLGTIQCKLPLLLVGFSAEFVWDVGWFFWFGLLEVPKSISPVIDEFIGFSPLLILSGDGVLCYLIHLER